MWLYPDDSRILELSLRCPPSQAFQVSQEARSYLISRDIRFGAVQETKTRAALSYYSSELQHLVTKQTRRTARSTTAVPSNPASADLETGATAAPDGDVTRPG
jgi:hypothetical protein